MSDTVIQLLSEDGWRRVSGLIEDIDDMPHLGRNATGRFIAIDVPAGATLLED